MGCCQTDRPIPHNHLNQKDKQHLSTLLHELSLEFKIEQSTLENKRRELNQQLLIHINRDKMRRSKEEEYVILQQTVNDIHLAHIYQFLELQCKRMLGKETFYSQLSNQTIPGGENKQNTLQKLKEERKKLAEPLENLLFAISVVDDGKISKKNSDLHSYQSFMAEKLPEVETPQKTEDDLLNYYKSKQLPSQQMIKQYVFALCQEGDISLSKFKEVGHSFIY